MFEKVILLLFSFYSDDDDDFDEGRNVDVEDDANSDDSDEGNLMIDDTRGAGRYL